MRHSEVLNDAIMLRAEFRGIRMTAARLLIVALFCSCGAACGFHLRGHGNTDQPLTVSIKAATTLSDRLLRNALAANGVSFATNAPRLRIDSYSVSSRNLSLVSRTASREEELTATLIYSVQAGDSLLVNRQRLQAVQVYSHTPSTALAAANERSDVERELLQQLAAQLARTLALTLHSPP